MLAYDGSESGKRALLDYTGIARRAHAELFLIAVVPPPVEFIGGEVTYSSREHDEVERRRYRKVLDEGLRSLADSGHVASGDVAHGEAVVEIAKYAGARDADLIIVGHGHKGGWASRWWRRSVAEALIDQAPCSVLVAKAK